MGERSFSCLSNKKVEEIRTFCFRNDLDIDEFPIRKPNVDRWDQVKILSPVNLLSDEYCEILVSNFQITMSCFDVKNRYGIYSKINCRYLTACFHTPFLYYGFKTPFRSFEFVFHAFVILCIITAHMKIDFKIKNQIKTG